MSGRPCVVWRSPRRDGMYLITAHGADLTRLPPELVSVFGAPQQSMVLVLEPGRKLARTTGAAVLDAIDQHGFYLQVPEPPPEWIVRLPDEDPPA